MGAANHNLVIDQGTSFVVELEIKEDDVVKNLTGYSARAQARTTKASDTVAATFSCSIPTPSNGKIKIELSPATSNAMASGQYFYDLEIYTSNDAIVKRILEGTVNLTQGVTR